MGSSIFQNNGTRFSKKISVGASGLVAALVVVLCFYKGGSYFIYLIFLSLELNSKFEGFIL